jgi:hypothetical protein
MRKCVLAAALILMSLCFAENLSAGNFGVFGGANFYTYKPKDIGVKTLTQWNAGLAYKCNLPLGFQLHPTLMYSVKDATDANESLDLSVGYLELMASLQWGIDLILFRPFLDVSPYVGYGLNRWSGDRTIWNAMDKLDYGIGLGGGLQIWCFQLAARYNWSFGGLNGAKLDKSVSNADFSGVTLSLTYFFTGRR